jgi:branched-chain amino acid transport system permease protein
MVQPTSSQEPGGLKHRIQRLFAPVPLLGFLLGFLACVLIEQAVGHRLADLLGLPKMPVMFGLVTIFKVIAGIVNTLLKDAEFQTATLVHIPMAVIYVLLVYALPMTLAMARVAAPLTNRAAGALQQLPIVVTALVHLGLLYAVFHLWSGMSDYRLITLKLMLIAVLFTLSLNIINGYMGEFSCSHPGFMAIGAYISSLFSVGLFVDDRVLGAAKITFSAAYLTFPLALALGGWPLPSGPSLSRSPLSRPGATTWRLSAWPSSSS